MIEIKTAVAFYDPQAELSAVHLLTYFDPQYNEPVVIVHGLTESEVHEAAALLAKSREVCEWRAVKSTHKRPIVLEWVASGHYAYPPETRVGCAGVIRPYHNEEPKFCPSCGRRVVIAGD